MTLDELNRQVTNAITRAASLPPDSMEAWAALREVSSLEESIARETSPQEITGEAARLGAVTAAVDAGEPLRALQLADRYLSENLAPEVRMKLEDVAREAEVQLTASSEPTVAPVTFTLRRAS